MKTRDEIKKAINDCAAVKSWTISKGPCPFNEFTSDCCAECNFIAALVWVLDGHEKE